MKTSYLLSLIASQESLLDKTQKVSNLKPFEAFLTKGSLLIASSVNYFRIKKSQS